MQAKFAANVQPDTVWTWNAIGKRRGAWRLDKDAPEGRQGFLLNHLISDITPRGDYANADPVTGQAAWFDLRVRIAKASTRRNRQRAAVPGAGPGPGRRPPAALRRAIPQESVAMKLLRLVTGWICILLSFALVVLLGFGVIEIPVDCADRQLPRLLSDADRACCRAPVSPSRCSWSGCGWCSRAT